MRYSLKISKQVYFALLLLLMACSGGRVPQAEGFLPAPYAALAKGGLVYDASFQYKEHQASGLLVVKRLQPSDYHVVLLSKFGVGLMEFKLQEERVQWIRTFDQLKDNRKAQALLERDFRMLLLSSLDQPKQVKRVREKQQVDVYLIKGKPSMRLEVEKSTGRVLYAENRGGLNLLKTKVRYEYQQGEVPADIALWHSHIDMRLDLRLLKINHAER